jgi:hypothetical protein
MKSATVSRMYKSTASALGIVIEKDATPNFFVYERYRVSKRKKIKNKRARGSRLKASSGISTSILAKASKESTNKRRKSSVRATIRREKFLLISDTKTF